MKKRNLYVKVVEWSEQDQCLIGRVPGVALRGVHGRNEKKVFEKLCELLDEWIKIFEEGGASLPPPLQASFSIRVLSLA